MGLFDLFTTNEEKEKKTIEPSEDQFIDSSEPIELINNQNNNIKNLDSIYDFCSIDFEERGYQDALINPDSSYKNDNLNLLIEDLSMIINQAKNNYSTSLKTLNFHIKTRKDAGLIDIVDELQTKKSILEQHKDEVLRIEDETQKNTGIVERLKLSYNRGFNRGLASISKEILTIEA
jgi:hypothetical protein